MSNEPELRRDPVIGRWVIVASERANRPYRFQPAETPTSPPDDCPFCPGHEERTPEETLSYRPEGSLPNENGWWIRVVPNKYPALQLEGAIRREGVGMYDRISGIGAHEVIIETPSHYNSLADLSDREVEEVLWAYRDRILDLKQDDRFRYILVFKNHGAEAGASMDHPHSQIMAMPIVPKRVQEELEGAARYWDYKERCVFCDIIHQEQKERERIVEENDSFIAILPFASRFPYEVWLMPKRHSLFYHDIKKRELQDLARALRVTLAKLKILLNDPHYNFMIHTTPFDEKATTPYYHWHIEITPKTTKVAGFEWGTGFHINPVPPEEAARQLAEVDVSQPQIIDVEAMIRE